MGIGFGRVVVNGREHDDPYRAGLDKVPLFEVVSVSGPRYRVEQMDQHRWRVGRMDETLGVAEGSIRRGGNTLNRWYSYTRKGRLLALGHQNVFINAVFGLIGDLDRRQ
ncbi:hypothetical protein ACEXQE_06690 [Herbiconiux sp. P17]|uniref:hypothetical protein n=1 Tax=Herbiconiux wuyangfengii TaxID=3342794 RepID=UPI0035B7AFC1